MMTEEQKYERFEAYINGKMTNKEIAAIESELAVNQDMRTEMALHRKSHKAIAYLNQRDLKRRIVAIDDETKSSSSQAPIRKLVIRVAVAASIALLAVFIIVFSNDRFTSEPSLAELSEAYFAPTHSETFRGANTDEKHSYEKQLISADSLYKLRNYDAAIQEYKRLSLIDNTLNDRAEWNLVMSYLLSDTHQSKFIEALNQIVEDPTHMFQEKAVSLQSDY